MLFEFIEQLKVKRRLGSKKEDDNDKRPWRIAKSDSSQNISQLTLLIDKLKPFARAINLLLDTNNSLYFYKDKAKIKRLKRQKDTVERGGYEKARPSSRSGRPSSARLRKA